MLYVARSHSLNPSSLPVNQLAQHIKEIRAKATSVLAEISAALISYSEKEGTAERRKEVVEACAPVTFKTMVRSFRCRVCTTSLTRTHTD